MPLIYALAPLNLLTDNVIIHSQKSRIWFVVSRPICEMIQSVYVQYVNQIISPFYILGCSESVYSMLGAPSCDVVHGETLSPCCILNCQRAYYRWMLLLEICARGGTLLLNYVAQTGISTQVQYEYARNSSSKIYFVIHFSNKVKILYLIIESNKVF